MADVSNHTQAFGDSPQRRTSVAVDGDIDVTPRVYEELVKNYDNFVAHSLVSLYEFSEP